MNYLELVQRLDQETGDRTAGITTVVAQTGKPKRLVDWTNSAWKVVQTKHRDWGWIEGTMGMGLDLPGDGDRARFLAEDGTGVHGPRRQGHLSSGKEGRECLG